MRWNTRLILHQAADYQCGCPRVRGLTQGQALQNPASRVTSGASQSAVINSTFLKCFSCYFQWFLKPEA
jgi:hypothetical protein